MVNSYNTNNNNNKGLDVTASNSWIIDPIFQFTNSYNITYFIVIR